MRKTRRALAIGVLLLLCRVVSSIRLAAQTETGDVGLTYISGSSVKVEQLFADCDWQVKAKDGSCLRTASQTATRFKIQGTDIGSSFEHEGRLFFVFGDTISPDTSVNYFAGDSLAYSSTTDPEAGVVLNFYMNTNGTPLFVRMPNINMGGNNIPNSGISLNDGVYFLCNVGADSPVGKPSDHSILVRFDERTQTFTAGRTVSTLPGHFIHAAIHKSGADVLIFGEGNYRASDIYLSTVPASSFAAGTGTRYFAGLANGKPTWATTEAAAVPVVQDNPLHGPAWPNDTPAVGNMSVAYSEDLKLWLMTYDGGKTQSSGTRGVHFTYAQEPWGPWAAPQLIFNDIRDDAYGKFIHNPSIVPNPPGDGLNGPTIGPNDPYTTPGGSYAPMMVERFTRVAGDTLKIYYALSTWNPYTIVMMRSEFKITRDKTYSVTERGGASFASVGAGSAVSAGYSRIQPDTGSTTPSGVAIFGLRQDGTLVSEVGVPAVPARTSGRIYAEIAGALNAGLAIANPNSSAASINFQFIDSAGVSAGTGTMTVPANGQIAQFLDQAPLRVYRTPTFQGTFGFTSTLPVAVVALRGVTNARGDFLMSTLPVVDTTAPASTGTAVVPHFADGGGWTTQVLLVNPGDDVMTGSLQFLNPAGAATNVAIGGQTASSFSYSVPRRSSQKLATTGVGSATASGSIRIVPTGGGAAPVPLIVFSYKPAGITVSEAGVPVTSGAVFRVYVESSGTAGARGSIDSGIAAANTSSASATVTFDVTDLSGAPVARIAPVAITVPAMGQSARFLSEIFPSLPKPFKGVLRITTTSAGLSVVGLRTRTNELGEFLITTTPPANENTPSGSAESFFPQVADGGGYTTQFILFSGSSGQTASGRLKLIKQDGSDFGIVLK
jgi:hypothetical protein